MQTNTTERITSPTQEIEHSSENRAEIILREVNEIVERDLKAVITPEKNINASNDRQFRHPFGRDTAISADRLLRYDQEVAHQAIILLFSNQGVITDKITGERHGKIFHEYKVRDHDPEQQVVFDDLRASTGIGDEHRILSYTSVDATPEAIHLVSRYVNQYGRDILQEKVNRQGEMITIEECLSDAVQWLRTNISHSDIGLVGTRRTNLGSVTVADLLDGGTSFMHADGKTLVNHSDEVNTINFQSLSYQAFVDAAELTSDESERQVLLGEAEDLRKKTIEHFWIPEKGRVAMAIDRDEHGKPRRLETDSILPAVAIRTGIFAGRSDIVEAIFRGLYTSDIMTCVGPRVQSLAMDVGYTRYQEPPWPVLIGRVIEGAIRCNEYAIAVDLIERMLMGVYKTGKSEEFHQVTKDNELGIYTNIATPDTRVIIATNKPESPQAWTAATVWAITHELLPIVAARMHSSDSPQIGESIDLLINKRIKTILYVLDQAEAWRREAEIMTA